ncbi:SgcJ/EcaC family oxidoreductase [Bradyrhizobium sp. I1.7.5]|uniref:SgcJ/EcaC family oxidoreductase n=1 Tax=Bradyrhizobium sp. I1.7.5 TaxID=3156363 RepID=UPI0033914BFD
MKQINALAALVALGVVTFGTASMSGAQQTGGNEDELEIRKVIVEMTEGFNNHDGKAAARMYAPDARFVSVRGDMMNGHAGIEKGLSAILSGRAKNATQRTMDVTVRFIRPDVALANVTNELSGLVAPDGHALPSHQELSLRVFIKEAGVWQIAAFHNTLVAPFAPPPR